MIGSSLSVMVNQGVLLLERATNAVLRHSIVVPSLQNPGGQEELLLDLLRPLLAKVGWRDN